MGILLILDPLSKQNEQYTNVYVHIHIRNRKWLRACSVIQEDSNSVRSSTLGSSQSPISPVQWILMSSSGLHEHLHSHTYLHIGTHSYILNIFIEEINTKNVRILLIY